jgi:hypothetical protein
MLDASFIYNIGYGVAHQPNPFKMLVKLSSTLAPVGNLVISAGLGVGFWLLGCRKSGKMNLSPGDETGPPRDMWTLVLLWMAFDLAGVLAGGRGFEHYFIALAPSLSAAAAMAYWHVKHLTIPPQFPLQASFLVLTLGPLFFVQAGDAIQLVSAAPDPAFAASSQMARIDRWRLASDYLQTVRKPTDTLFIWQYFPRAYYQMQLSNGIKYLSAAYVRDSGWAHEKVGTEIIRELQRKYPTFIVDEGDNSPGSNFKSSDSDPFYLQFQDFLEEHYNCVYSVPQLMIYQLSR